MLSTPVLHINHRENVDGIMRKPGTASTRKAFQDRDVNNKMFRTPSRTPSGSQSTIKVKQNIFQDFGTPSAAKKVEISEPPTWMYECSYKPVKDTYADILAKEVIPNGNLLDFFASMYTSPATPKTSKLSELKMPEVESVCSPLSPRNKFSRNVSLWDETPEKVKEICSRFKFSWNVSLWDEDHLFVPPMSNLNDFDILN